jgi:RNA polymerase sigma-70 factor, ECF subfamily
MRAIKTDHRASHAGNAGTPVAARGRDTAFETLLLGELPSLTARARALEGSDAAAEDLVQDTIERALLHAGKFVLGTNLHSWLMQIMRNLFIDRYRARVRFTGLEVLESKPESEPEPEPTHPWQLVSFAEALEALDQLGEPLRGTFVLACLSGWSYRRIATRLGVPLATVGTRLLRARGHLRALLVARLVEKDGEWRRADRQSVRPSAGVGLRLDLLTERALVGMPALSLEAAAASARRGDARSAPVAPALRSPLGRRSVPPGAKRELAVQ